MEAKNLLLKCVKAIALLGISASGSSASTPSRPYPTLTNMNTTTSPPISPPKSTTQPATITSCSGTIDYWDSFLNDTMLYWQYASPSKFSSVWGSVQSQVASLNSRYIMIQANLWTIPSATWTSYESSIVNAISSYESILWGSAQDAVLTFADTPWTDDACFWQTCTDQLYASSSSYASATPSGYFEYVAEPPCCGSCVVHADGVRLAYWPTPAPVPGVSTLIDTNGTTYVSPSVYAWFTKLYAWDYCSALSPPGTIDTFLCFHPTELRTSILASQDFFSGNTYWTTIDYADFGPQCTCTPPNCPSDMLVGYQTITCTPQLSMPGVVTKLFPEWAGCAVDFEGAFDPPIALTIAAGLTTPKPTSAKPTIVSSSNGPINTPDTGPTAQPASLPSPPVANPTPQPSTGTIQSLLVVPVQSVFVSAASLPPGGVTTVAAPTLIINGQTITANPQGSFVLGTSTFSTDTQGNVVIDGQTLTVGHAITVSGSTVSLAAGATEIVFWGTSTTKIASIILGFLGVGGASSTSTSLTSTRTNDPAPVQFTGATCKGPEISRMLVVFVILPFFMI